MLTPDVVRKIQAMAAAHKSISEIAATCFCDPKTVRKYVHLVNVPKDSGAASVPHHKYKYAEAMKYENIIRTWLVQDKAHYYKQRHTITRVRERLQQEFGVALPVQAVSEVYHQIQNEINLDEPVYDERILVPGVARCSVMPFNIKTSSSSAERVFLLFLTFPFSRTIFCQVIFSKAPECIAQALLSIFHKVGKVPNEIVYHASTGIFQYNNGTVDISKSQRLDALKKTACYYMFLDRYSSSHELFKQTCINLNHSFRKFLPDMPLVSDLDAYNFKLIDFCLAKSLEVHISEPSPFVVNFETEKDNMRDLPAEIIPEVFATTMKRTDAQASFIIDQKVYYLSPEFRSQKVYVAISYKHIQVYDGRAHNLLEEFSRHYFLSDVQDTKWQHSLKVLNTKPVGFRNCELITMLSPDSQQFIKNCSAGVLARIVHFLYDKSITYPISDLMAVVDQAIAMLDTSTSNLNKLIGGKYDELATC